MKRAQKKFERDPRKQFFCERNPTLWAKAKNHEQSSWFNNDGLNDFDDVS